MFLWDVPLETILNRDENICISFRLPVSGQGRVGEDFYMLPFLWWKRILCGVKGPANLAEFPAASNIVVLYCNFTSLAFLGLLGFLMGQLNVRFFTTLLSAAKLRITTFQNRMDLDSGKRWLESAS